MNRNSKTIDRPRHSLANADQIHLIGFPLLAQTPMKLTNHTLLSTAC
jgi:hypothetical protein